MVSFLWLQFFLAYRSTQLMPWHTGRSTAIVLLWKGQKTHIGNQYGGLTLLLEMWSAKPKVPLMTWLDWDGGPPLFNPRVCACTVTLLAMMFTQSPLLLLLTQVKQDMQRWFVWSMSLRKSTLHSCSKYFGKATILHKVTFYSIRHTTL